MRKLSGGKVVIASGNAGKLAEIAEVLQPFGVVPVPQAELGITGADEPHGTFVENALAKARHAAAASGLQALADDSGVCVAALNFAPGVRSARYAGEDAGDEENNRKLVAALANEPDRRAFYYAAMVMVESPEDPAPLFAEGLWRGEIVDEPRGGGGFGYDPHFLDPSLGKTGAEMSLEEKNKVSHRGQSLRALIGQLRGRGLGFSR